MAGAPSRRSSFRTAEYWAAIEVIADDLINHTAPHTPRPSGDARGTLQRLSSRGFGPVSLFDLCALLVLAAPRSPAVLSGPGDRTPAIPPPEPTPTAPAAAPIAELKRGPVTVAAHPTERHIQHLRELEEAVAEALLVSPEHPRARGAVRRALMAGGRTVQDATAVYGIVCELFERPAS
ncbi:hypothetical protein OG883_45340 [Streptomyces sp. NBC_01142]|uniref:hypothetical protein n=1 Tax=Streptomyces sp. NBC_01142 TaxID=2975865 RepID=UPI0022527C85|nr:hypothetical protein [Streptomyces sp. NBC_01142]MCX4826865.1 hypothetical protein [Streptomyces sp. NBC_01142]